MPTPQGYPSTGQHTDPPMVPWGEAPGAVPATEPVTGLDIRSARYLGLTDATGRITVEVPGGPFPTACAFASLVPCTAATHIASVDLVRITPAAVTFQLCRLDIISFPAHDTVRYRPLLEEPVAARVLFAGH